MSNAQVEGRGCITLVMWLSYLGFIYVAMTMIDVWAALIAFVIMIPLIMGMGAIWNLFGNESAKGGTSEDTSGDTEKRKRANLDAVLRDLSDEDLMRLRQRLQDGTIDDDVLYNNLVGDDGELRYDDNLRG